MRKTLETSMFKTVYHFTPILWLSWKIRCKFSVPVWNQPSFTFLFAFSLYPIPSLFCDTAGSNDSWHRRVVFLNIYNFYSLTEWTTQKAWRRFQPDWQLPHLRNEHVIYSLTWCDRKASPSYCQLEVCILPVGHLNIPVPAHCLRTGFTLNRAM